MENKAPTPTSIVSYRDFFLYQQHNPAFQPAGIVGSGSLRHDVRKVNHTRATYRTRTGLKESQKAVHAHPDHVSSWAVLATSITAHDIAKSREELGRDKSRLGARLSQFVESAGIGCTRELSCKRVHGVNFGKVRKIGD